MPTFEYQAVDARGKKSKGNLEADSPRHLRQLLRERGLSPLSVKESAASSSKTRSGGLRLLRSKVKTNDLVMISRQLATLVSSGMQLDRSLYLIGEQAEKASMRRLMHEVRSYLAEGSSFAAALRRAQQVFPPDFIATIAAGEESGHMTEVLERLADETEQQAKTKQTLGGALVYPAVMVFVAIAIVVLLLIYVVPQVTEVFEQQNQQLPPLTDFLIDASAFLRAYGMLLAVVLGACVLVFLLLLKRSWFRFWWHRKLLGVPIIGVWLRSALISRWARSLGMLYGAGVNSTLSLRIASEGVNNDYLRQVLTQVTDRVREGRSINRALRETGHFPGFLVHMVASGESSGDLTGMLLKCSDYYDQLLKTTIEASLRVFEPLLILVMGGMVLAIVLAILMPIFQINQMII